MSELELRLVALRDEIAFPETPELVVAAGERARQRPRWQLRLAIALAALLAVTGAVLALSPGARSALGDFFGIGGATIRIVDELPPARATSGYLPGLPASLAEARGAVEFQLRLPPGEPPAEVILDRDVAGGAVSLVWCCDPELTLTQFRGSSSIPYVQKVAGEGTSIELVEVDEDVGYWLEGAAHDVVFVDDAGAFHGAPSRIVGNVLLWVDGDVTLRLEGRITKAEAIAIARSIE